jgi:hypothetical protein
MGRQRLPGRHFRVQLRVTRQAVLGVSYTGQLASNVRDHGAKGNFTWTF